MTIEALQEQKAILKGKIEKALQEFYEATKGLDVEVSGRFGKENRPLIDERTSRTECYSYRLPFVNIDPFLI